MHMYQHPSHCSPSHLLLHHHTSLRWEMATFCTSMGRLLLLYVPKTSCYLHSYFSPRSYLSGNTVHQDQEFLVISAVKWQFKKQCIWYWYKYTRLYSWCFGARRNEWFLLENYAQWNNGQKFHCNINKVCFFVVSAKECC